MISLANSNTGLANRRKFCVRILFCLALCAGFILPDVAAAGEIAILSPKNAEKVHTFSSVTQVDLNCRISGITRIFVNGVSVPVPMGRQLSIPLAFDGTGRKEINIVALDTQGKLLSQACSFLLVRTYPDIADHWARREIEYVATLGYMTGKYGSLLFMPDSPISRAELAQLLTQLRQVKLGIPTANVANDVLKQYWAAPYISAAIDHHILALTREGFFYPEAMVTRADAVVAVSRAFRIPLQSAQQKFLPDLSDQYWARDAIYTAMIEGRLPEQWNLQQGFFPGYAISRGEVAALLARSPVILSEICSLEQKTVSFPSSRYAYTGAQSVISAAGRDDYIRVSERVITSNNTQKAVISYNTNLMPFAGKAKRIEIDLTAVGRLANTAMLDDGVWGDAYARDGVFTVELVPSPGISGGEKRLPIQVIDVNGNTYEAIATLAVLAPPVAKAAPENPTEEVISALPKAVTVNQLPLSATPSVQQAVATESALPVTPAMQEVVQKEPVTYTVQPGDTLRVVSLRATGSPNHWKAIAEHNNIAVEERIIDGQMSYYSYIEIGQILTIPPEVLP